MNFNLVVAVAVAVAVLFVVLLYCFVFLVWFCFVSAGSLLTVAHEVGPLLCHLNAITTAWSMHSTLVELA